MLKCNCGLVIFQSDYGPVRKYCNIWRNYWDISDKWDSVQGYITFYGKNNKLFQNYTGPGGFFDPDMVQNVNLLIITTLFQIMCLF